MVTILPTDIAMADMTRTRSIITAQLPPHIAACIAALGDGFMSSLEEIRLRAGRPVTLHTSGEYLYITRDGTPTMDGTRGVVADVDAVRHTFAQCVNRSVYAHMDAIRGGYITIEGGHRVGIVGRVCVENGVVVNITDISGVNLRVARQCIGAAKGIIRHVDTPRGIANTLIISPPGAGKTTLLRDLSRMLAARYRVCIADERSEIAACVGGIPQLDVGVMCDVLDNCPKAVGIHMLLRSMNPEVIIADEIGAMSDVEALRTALNSGVSIITSVHGHKPDDLQGKPVHELLPSFDCVITLSRRLGAGTVEAVAAGGEVC